MTKGKDSRSLWGPVLGRGANTPPSLSNIHDFGAFNRFKCFFGPRAYDKRKLKKQCINEIERGLKGTNARTSTIEVREEVILIRTCYIEDVRLGRY